VSGSSPVQFGELDLVEASLLRELEELMISAPVRVPGFLFGSDPLALVVQLLGLPGQVDQLRLMGELGPDLGEDGLGIAPLFLGEKLLSGKQRLDRI
jgi:hypothetical protein